MGPEAIPGACWAAVCLDRRGVTIVSGLLSALAIPLLALGQVEEAWIAHWRPPFGGEDVPTDLAIDAAGNLYVAGTSSGDYLVLKYDSSGRLSWCRSYDGPGFGNGDERLTAMALDPEGNVVVTGQAASSTAPGSFDYTTIKYSPGGDKLWVARHPGPSYVARVELAVDRSGNVYVAGIAGSGSTATDFVTVKYGRDGKPLWEARYDGPEGKIDEPKAIAVDAGGNVHVTGSTTEGFYPVARPRSQYATVKYDPDGNLLWEAVAAHTDPDGVPAALAIDREGSVIETGQAGTVKYAAAGNLLWALPLGEGGASGQAVAVDRQGNVLVAGPGGATKYSPDGKELWKGDAVKGVLRRALALDPAGGVYLSGVLPGVGPGLAKYGADGTLAWTVSYELPGAAPIALSVGPAGSVFTALTFQGDYGTFAHDPEGKPLWSDRHDGPAGKGRGTQPSAVALDPRGDIVVAGQAGGDIATLKYDAAGNQLWVARIDNPEATTLQEQVVALAVAPDGSVHVAGETWSSCDFTGCLGLDYAVAKYDSAGKLLWRDTYDGPAAPSDSPRGIALDGAGNVYVTGGSINGFLNVASATLKYDPAGSLIWVARHIGAAATALAVDEVGNAWVAASSNRADAELPGAVWKYDPQGNQLWIAYHETRVRLSTAESS
ncbi:MAG: SBBP repeat-containing protein [Planctomycetes bacterium]|nr:SBBP repeat-containing protein [Planctomycetota bacterium]